MRGQSFDGEKERKERKLCIGSFAFILCDKHNIWSEKLHDRMEVTEVPLFLTLNGRAV